MSRRSALRGIVTVSGIAVALPLMGSLAGCSAGAKASLDGQMELIDAVTNLIIPKTDTPGARAADVPAYVRAVFVDHFTEEQQRDFVKGLGVFDERATANDGVTFAKATEQVQTKVLAELDAERHPTWQQLRDITIFGFYTSEAATEELAFEEIPGRYNGCIPFEDVGRAWLDRGV